MRYKGWQGIEDHLLADHSLVSHLRWWARCRDLRSLNSIGIRDSILSTSWSQSRPMCSCSILSSKASSVKGLNLRSNSRTAFHRARRKMDSSTWSVEVSKNWSWALPTAWIRIYLSKRWHQWRMHDSMFHLLSCITSSSWRLEVRSIQGRGRSIPMLAKSTIFRTISGWSLTRCRSREEILQWYKLPTDMYSSSMDWQRLSLLTKRTALSTWTSAHVIQTHLRKPDGSRSHVMNLTSSPISLKLLLRSGSSIASSLVARITTPIRLTFPKC